MRPITDELVEEVTRKIVERFKPLRILAFGSYARGQHGADSDLDLIVEMETDKPFGRRSVEITSLFLDRDWGLDLVVYTPEEFRSHRRTWGTLLSLVADETKVLYERPA